MPPTQKPAGVAARRGARLRVLREERGLTQEQVAWECGFSKGYVSLIEAGKRVPTVSALVVLAKHLDTAVADLFAWDAAEPRLALLDAARRGDAAAARTALRALGLGDLRPMPRAAAAQLRAAEDLPPKPRGKRAPRS